MDLLNKVKEYLTKEKGYDFASEFWTDENMCIVIDAVNATEGVLLGAKKSTFPISDVIFFELKGSKYLASNGAEVTTEMLLQHEHTLFNNEGYIILKHK